MRVMPYEMESGLLTAEKFGTVLAREAARMQRQELPLTMVLVKLDHFAEFEHTYGRTYREHKRRLLRNRDWNCDASR